MKSIMMIVPESWLRRESTQFASQDTVASLFYQLFWESKRQSHAQARSLETKYQS
jgi:hypothetical protein